MKTYCTAYAVVFKVVRWEKGRFYFWQPLCCLIYRPHFFLLPFKNSKRRIEPFLKYAINKKTKNPWEEKREKKSAASLKENCTSAHAKENCIIITEAGKESGQWEKETEKDHPSKRHTEIHCVWGGGGGMFARSCNWPLSWSAIIITAHGEWMRDNGFFSSGRGWSPVVNIW